MLPSSRAMALTLVVLLGLPALLAGADASHCVPGIRILAGVSVPPGGTVEIEGCEIAHVRAASFVAADGTAIVAQWGRVDGASERAWVRVPQGAVEGIAFELDTGGRATTTPRYLSEITLASVDPRTVEHLGWVRIEGTGLDRIDSVTFGGGAQAKIFHGDPEGEGARTVLFAQAPDATRARSGALTLYEGEVAHHAGVVELKPRSSSGSAPAPCLGLGVHPQVQGPRCNTQYSQSDGSGSYQGNGCECALHYRARSPAQAAWGGEFTVITAGAAWSPDGTAFSPTTVCLKSRSRCYPVQGAWELADGFRGTIPFEVPAGQYQIEVRRGDGISVDSGSDRIEIPRPPFYFSLDKWTAAPGETVTLSALGISRAPHVTFGGARAQTTPSGPDALVATLPGDAQSGAVVVEMPSGDRSYGRGLFVVKGGPPAASGFAPGVVGARGLPLQTLSVEGQNLGLGSQVRFCAAAGCTPAASALGSSTRVLAAFPALAPGDYDVEVRNAASDWTRIGARRLTVAEAPTVTQVTLDPASGLRILGSGFVGVEEVKLLAPTGGEGEGEHGLAFAVVSPSEIRASLPRTSGAFGSLLVMVRAAGGTGVGSAIVAIDRPEPIRLLGFEPVEGLPGSGLALTTNIQPGDAGVCLRPVSGGTCYLAMGDAPALRSAVSPYRTVTVVAKVEEQTPEDVTTRVRVPYSLPPGEYHLVVSARASADDTSADLDPPTFRVLPGAPRIDGVSPSSGRSSTTVTVSGANFVPPLVVLAKPPNFDFFVPLPRWDEVDAATVRFDVPLGSPSGAYTLKVATLGGEATSAEGAFSVPPGALTFTRPPPSLTSFSPASGAVGTRLTLAGSNFERPTAVCLQRGDDCHILPTTIKGPTALEALIPEVGVGYAQSASGDGPNLPVPALPRPLAGGEYKLRIVTLGGQADSSALTPATFTLHAQPSVSRIAPARGSPGTEVVISGDGLGAATSVRMGGVSVAFETRGADLVVRAPASAGYGLHRVEVETPGGVASALQRFVLAPAAPRVTGFEPATFTPGLAGLAAGELTFRFTVFGENLLGPVQVCLYGSAGCITTASAIAASADGTRISFDMIATLPPGQHFVQVGTLGGIDVLTDRVFLVNLPTSDDAFRQPAPTITSFTPAAGEPPFDVDIRGSGFGTTYGVQLRKVKSLAPSEAIGDRLGATIDEPASYLVFERMGDGHVRARFPEGLQSGKYVVAVQTLGGVASTRHPDGESAEESALGGIRADGFGQSGDPDGEVEVRSSPHGRYVPRIDSFSPASARPGEKVTLVGTNLGPPDPVGVSNSGLLTFTSVRLRVPGTEREFGATMTSSGPGPEFSVSGSGVDRDLHGWRLEFAVPDAPVGDYEIVLRHVFGDDDTRDLAPATLSVLPRRGLEPPEIHRIERSSDAARFTLHGKNLSGPSTACLDGPVCYLLAQTAASSDGTWLSLRVPAFTPAGQYAVTVHRPGGVARSAERIDVAPAVPPPQITNIVQERGSAAMKIQVQGRDFPAGLAPCMLAEGDCHPMVLDQIATTSFWAYPNPTMGFGTYRIRISSPAGSATSPDTFTLVAPPSIVKVTPEDGARPGESITIEGSSLQRASVAYGGKPLADAQVNAEGTRITGKVPADATPLDIIIRVTTDIGSTTHVVKTRLPQPIVQTWTPMKATQGTLVEVRGTDLAPITKLCVRLVGSSAPCRSVPPPTPGADPRASFRFAMRPGASESFWGVPTFAPGVYSIEVTTPEGTFRTGDLAARGVTLVETPDITRIDPSSASPGDVVTVSGTGFGSGAKALFGATEGEILSRSRTRLAVKVPLLSAGSATGAFALKVETPEGSDTAPFTYVPRIIVVTGASPARGAAGALVALTGSGFTGVNDVEIGGVDVDGLRVVSDTRLEFALPQNAPPGPQAIRVMSPASPPGLRAFVVDHPAPVITGISTHAAKPGEFFWIEGRNLRATYWTCLGHSDGCVGLGYPNPVRGDEPGDTNERIYVKIPLRTQNGLYRPEVTTPGGTAKYVGEALHVSWR